MTLNTTPMDNTCPHCGRKHECASSEGGGGPSAGDISICIGCAKVAIFDDDMQLRLPTNEEKFLIYANPNVAAEIARIVTALQLAKANTNSKKQVGEA